MPREKRKKKRKARESPFLFDVPDHCIKFQEASRRKFSYSPKPNTKKGILVSYNTYRLVREQFTFYHIFKLINFMGQK